MKDKAGNKITFKEFMSRWKQGIESLTPAQKLKNEINGTFVSLLGFVVALIAVIIKMDDIGLLSYGLILIFIGSVWTTGIKWISLRQQYKYMNGLDLSILEEKTEEKTIDLDKDKITEEVMKGGDEK